MPNYVTNKLYFDCSQTRFNEIAEYLRGSEEAPLGRVDFNVLIPKPASLDIESSTRGQRGFEAYQHYMQNLPGIDEEAREEFKKQCMSAFTLRDEDEWNLGKQYYENLMDYGAKTWYEWSNMYWGTKWNAVDCQIAPEERELVFETAWSSVPKIISRISSAFPDVGIRYQYADEDLGHNVGEMLFSGGNIVWELDITDGSREAYELSAMIQGIDLEDYGYKLVNGIYEYVD